VFKQIYKIGHTNCVQLKIKFAIKNMAFSAGISRLQRIINFVSIDYRSKKEIMAYLREFNIIISYKTLERDLKQIKEDLGFDLEYKRNVGYKCENENVIQAVSGILDANIGKVGYENELFKIINVFDFEDKTYYNCLDKRSKKVFLINS
jgi:hypothetical protein